MPGVLTGLGGRTAPIVLAGALLVAPVAAVASASAPSALAGREATSCLTGPSALLAVDVLRACRAVRKAVPSWAGAARLVVDDGDPAVAAQAEGHTVTVHLAAWGVLTQDGRQAVLTHELVHVATESLTTQRTPSWLVEGFAEAVAWSDVRAVPDRVVAQELAAQVRAHRLPEALPSETDFTARPALAYQQAWLAVDLLLRERGSQRVLDLYRDAGVTQPRLAEGRFLHAWRAELVRRLS